MLLDHEHYLSWSQSLSMLTVKHFTWWNRMFVRFIKDCPEFDGDYIFTYYFRCTFLGWWAPILTCRMNFVIRRRIVVTLLPFIFKELSQKRSDFCEIWDERSVDIPQIQEETYLCFRPLFCKLLYGYGSFVVHFKCSRPYRVLKIDNRRRKEFKLIETYRYTRSLWCCENLIYSCN